MSKKPVIGILTNPGDGVSISGCAPNTSHISAPYVKFVECGGARVIPLIYNEPKKTLLQKLDLVNGVLFPGGKGTTDSHYKVVKEIFQKALQKNKGGDYFPVYAIHLGFELLIKIVREDKDILKFLEVQNRATSLQFSKTTLEGTVFGSFPPDLRDKLAKERLVNESHQSGISPEQFKSNEKLTKFFQILTTCTHEDDKVYVSTARSRQYPVTIFAWHPQKNAFEWALPEIPHNEDAIRVTQHAANFLVSESRKSSNEPNAEKVGDNLIYNFAPTYIRKYHDQVYIFT